MEIKIRALVDNVVLEPIFLDNKTDGGFDLTGIVDVNEKQASGIIHSFGEMCGKDLEGNYTLREGMTIVYNKHNQTPMTLDGKSYILIPYRNVFLSLD